MLNLDDFEIFSKRKKTWTYYDPKRLLHNKTKSLVILVESCTLLLYF